MTDSHLQTDGFNWGQAPDRLIMGFGWALFAALFTSGAFNILPMEYPQCTIIFEQSILMTIQYSKTDFLQPKAPSDLLLLERRLPITTNLYIPRALFTNFFSKIPHSE